MMTIPPARRRTLLLISAAVLAVACGLPEISGDGGEQGGDGGPSPTTTHSLEGAFDYNTMDDYVSSVVPMITDWQKETWPDLPQPRSVSYVPRGARGAEGCQDREG